MESTRNDELHPNVEIDIDDPYDSSTMLSTDLSQEEIIKIMEMTKKKPPPTLPLLHYKSNKLQNAELSKIFVILKYPGANKYLLFDSLNFFLLLGGRHDFLQEETTIASLIAKKCFNIFTAFKRNGTVLAGKNILLPELTPMVHANPNVTIKDAVSRYAYANRTTNFLYLPACWTAEGNEFKDIYPSFGDFKTFAGDFSDTITLQQFNETILGKSSPFLLPSEVTAIQAWRCLQMQADHKWKIQIEDSKIQKQDVVLSSMSLDLDYGLLSLKACCVGKLALKNIICAIECVLPKNQLMSRTSYVPNGTNWKFAIDSRFLPTINDKSGVYVLVPTPEHSVEVCKMWFFVPGIEHAPEEFLSKIKNAFQDSARLIVDLDQSCNSETKRLAISVIDSDSTSQATMIRGGILLPIVSFLLLSQTIPNVQLVMETYNGKQKGLSVNVTIDGVGTPDLDHAAESLIQKVISSDSILDTISRLCQEGWVQVDSARSSLGFGFRTCHKVRNGDSIAYSFLEFNENGHEIQFPMGYLPPGLCPNLSFGKSEKGNDHLGDATASVSGYRRVQSYLEYFSLQKDSNHHQKHSYHKTASNLAKATTSNDMQDTVNLSVLKVSLSETLQRLDHCFCNFHSIGGSRTEVAIQPIISKDRSCLVFDAKACILKCWRMLVDKTIFYRNQDLAQYGAVNSAACVLGYRFALDALSSNRAPEDNQQQQHTFGFMRYLNSVLNTICNGKYVHKNPKLFLSELGAKVGRPLNLIPDIPFNVSERICEYLQTDLPVVEAPRFPDLTIREHLIKVRIAANTSMGEMRSVIKVCYGCGKCFYGSPETQTELLHKHLAKYPMHSNRDWHQRSVTGSVWEADWRRREIKLKRALYGRQNECSDEQRMAYELLFGCDGYKSRNVCLVGVPASGKTWIAKKLSKLLECVFFNPGEVIRCGPLGRVACSFHPDARTIHSTLQMRPNGTNQYPESLEDLQIHLNRCAQECFDQLKVLIVSEALMCTGPHLEALLSNIKNKNPNCIFLFDGDCQQVAMKPTTGYPSQPFITRSEFPALCPETTIIILEKCTKHRIKNPEKLQHLGLMRKGQATEATVQFFQKTKRDPQHKKTIIRLFANSRPASLFNEERLKSILQSNSTPIWHNLHAKDTLKGTNDVVKMTATEEASLPVDDVIRVVKGAPILIVQNHIAETLSGQNIYVGNGTTGVFQEYDSNLDVIFAKVNIASKDVFVRIKRRAFSTATKTRSQFPFMLAWAATIHKVQGMEFDCVEVDFCLDTLSTSGASDFYQGLAYMALSRAETVIVQGRLTLALLNNINRQSLQWWNMQLSKWIEFKRKKSTPSKLFRNAIHMHNWYAAASQKQVHKIVTAPATASVTDSENVRCDVHGFETFSEAETDKTEANAATEAKAEAAAAAQTKAEAKARAKAAATDQAPASADTVGLTPSKPHKRPALESASGFAKRPVRATAQDSAKTRANAATDQAPSSAITGGLAPSKRPSAIAQQQQPKKQTLVVEEASFEVDWDSASRQLPSASGRTTLKLPLHWWETNKDKKKWIEKHLKTIQDNWNETTEELKTYSINWSKGIPLFHSEGFGEVELPLCIFLQKKHAAHSSCNTTPIHLQNFVDIGSGLGKAVCLMAALQPQFKCCFGIELLPDRHAHAAKQANLFAKKHVEKFVPFCPVSLVGGPCEVSDICRDKLMNAGLVWINNEIFSPELNQSILNLITDTVPKGCIVVSFKEILLTPRKGSTNDPSAFQVLSTKEPVAGACNWSHNPRETFTIQKT